MKYPEKSNVEFIVPYWSSWAVNSDREDVARAGKAWPWLGRHGGWEGMAVAGKTWWKEQEATGHIAPTLRKRSEQKRDHYIESPKSYPP